MKSPMSSTLERILAVPGRLAQGDTLTRIVATVGPASRSREMIERLIEAGVSVFRLNFSHGDLAGHAATLRTIREAAGGSGSPVAVLGDLCGPKIRIGRVPDPGIVVEPGERIIMHDRPIEARPAGDGRAAEFGTTLPSLSRDVVPGARLLVNDGQIRMLVLEAGEGTLVCTVTTGGRVTSGKGLNMPESLLSVRTITDDDWRCVDFAVAHGLDFLALSFVRHEEDIEALRSGIRQRASALGLEDFRLPIVAKIEVPSALRRIEAIVQASDAIMVARGDLGVELDVALVPVIQKRLLAIAQDYGKPAIVATQMLESMIESSMPTRAEVSDVATAIFDKADAVMLSAETATGRHPALAVEQMRRVARYTEAYLGTLPAESEAPARPRELRDRTAALAHGAWLAARDLGAACIAVWSQAGGGARLLSQNNFSIPIIALTSDPRAARQMQLLRGVAPLCVDVPEDLAALSRLVDRYVQETHRARAGDRVILLAGEPLGMARATNRLAIIEVGDPLSGFAMRPGAARPR